MTRTSGEDPETCDIARALDSPVAAAFVRIVMACRGVTDARARQLYLDYINRTDPDASHRRPGDCERDGRRAPSGVPGIP
ncbi:hypothetical protein ACRAVF_22620 [Bradyrhizobium oligotrophicum S58]